MPDVLEVDDVLAEVADKRQRLAQQRIRNDAFEAAAQLAEAKAELFKDAYADSTDQAQADRQAARFHALFGLAADIRTLKT